MAPLLIEDYSPVLLHKAGEKNNMADCLSRLPNAVPSELEGKNVVTPAAAYADAMEAFYTFLDDPELMESYLTLPEMTEQQRSPLDFVWMQQEQQQDAALQQLPIQKPHQYHVRQFTDSISLITYTKPNDNPENQWKICLTDGMLLPIVKWYHEYLGHVGSTRLRATLQTRYHHQ